MLSFFKDFYSLLNSAQRRQFYFLQCLIIVAAFTDIAGVASMGPFMALIGDISVLQRPGKLAMLYQYSGLNNPNDFIFWMGLAALGVLTLNAFLSAFANWRLAVFGSKIGTEIGDRLFRTYMHQPWLYHVGHSSAYLSKQIATESARVTGEVIQPLLIINSKIALAAFMSLAILAYNPFIALGIVAFVITAFLLIFKSSHLIIRKNGEVFSAAIANRFRLMAEGFGGVKDILILGRQDSFEKRFEHSGRNISRSQGTIHAFAYLPRYFIELVAFAIVIFLVLFLVKSHEGNLGELLPVLALYALAGFKLLPAFQQIYSMSATVRGGLPAFDSIRQDLLGESSLPVSGSSPDEGKIHLRQQISLENIHFTYPGKSSPVLDSLNLVIPANSVIGLVGASGSGKSTIIDLLLGLIHANSGRIMIDGQELSANKIRAWQNSLGFVPQSIFLADSSILENIGFGLPPEEIDLAKVNRAVKLAHLEDYIKQLPDGLHTQVGERGVQLSGGQRQRIGIARALYNDPAVLILDEATSALDGITEKIIMDAIHDFSGNKTIIMVAHRLTTVQQCDRIFFMANGKVVDQGTYRELLERNDTFRQMAAHADSQ